MVCIIINYLDSRHLCLSNYKSKTVNFFFKNYKISYTNKEIFLRKDLTYKNPISKLCEMNKPLSDYYTVGDNSIYFMLFSDYQFLVLRKIINQVSK